MSGLVSSRGVRRGWAAENATRSEGVLRLFRDRQSVARQSGITLIEMLVTVTVIGLVLAAASPNFASLMSVYPIRSGAREVYAQLENARMAAVTYNQSCRFDVGSGGTTYSVSPATCSTTHTTSSVALDAASKGVAISPVSSFVIFTSRGTALTSGTFTLTDSRGTSMSVAVGSAGRIRVQ